MVALFDAAAGLCQVVPRRGRAGGNTVFGPLWPVRPRCIVVGNRKCPEYGRHGRARKLVRRGLPAQMWRSWGGPELRDFDAGDRAQGLFSEGEAGGPFNPEITVRHSFRGCLILFNAGPKEMLARLEAKPRLKALFLRAHERAVHRRAQSGGIPGTAGLSVPAIIGPGRAQRHGDGPPGETINLTTITPADQLDHRILRSS